MELRNKPLNQKCYGSIPHIIGSRLGEGDHHINQKQQDIVLKKTRSGDDLVIVQEKLDGSNVAVLKLNGKIIAMTRAGYTAYSSPYEMHHIFAKWVEKNRERFDKLLNEGERVCGEWLLQAHGTRYELKHEPFVPFDIMTKMNRTCYHEFITRILPLKFVEPRIIHLGGAFSLKKSIEAIKESGHGAIDKVEGVIYRCEKAGKVDFLCKYVRQDKIDGGYLNGDKPLWNIEPSLII